jgi:plastocyanin
MKNKRFIQTLIILLGLIVFVGCGEADSPPHETHDPADTTTSPVSQEAETKAVVRENGIVIIDMYMTGSKSYSDPVGIHVEPGTTIRFVNRTGMHSATAYHPDNGFPHRIPPQAQSWDTGLMTRRNESFEVTLTVEGVYDYLCILHEAAGHVGRIVVGDPQAFLPPDDRDLPASVRNALPSVDLIVSNRVVWP